MIGFIYKITNKVNGKIYIGSTKKSVKSRWRGHRAEAKKAKCKFHRAIKKYGHHSFIVEEIYCTKDLTHLSEIEQYFIDFYNCLNDKVGYNSVPVFDGRELISNTMKAEWANPEKRQQRLELMKKNSHKIPIIGVNRFDLNVIQFESINEADRNGYRLGSVNQSLGRVCKHAYDYCWFNVEQGKPIEKYIEEAKEILKDKLDNTNIRPVVAINVNTGERKEYQTLFDAEKDGYRISAIRRILRGDRKAYKGYTWKFK